MHGKRPRLTSLAGQVLVTLVFRVRCPGCRQTTTLLPDAMLPHRHHSLTTIADTVAQRLETGASFRQIAADPGLPASETRSTAWGSPAAPLPWPSTICRWFQRFVSGAKVWWDVLLPEIQAKLSQALRPPSPPEGHPLLGTSGFDVAWSLLWLLRWLLETLHQSLERWPQALLLATARPANLDHTGWFSRPGRAPP